MTLTSKQARAVNKVQKLLAKSIALRNQMDAIRDAANAAVANLSEADRCAINRTEGLAMPELSSGYDVGTMIRDDRWADCHC